MISHSSFHQLKNGNKFDDSFSVGPVLAIEEKFERAPSSSGNL